MSFGNLSTDAGLTALNAHLTTRSYIQGYSAGSADVETYTQVANNVDHVKFPHVVRWYHHIASFTLQQRRGFRTSAVEVKEEKKEEKKAAPAKAAAAAAAPAKSSPAPAKKDGADDEDAPEPEMSFDDLEGGDTAGDADEVARIMQQKEEEAKKAKAAAKKSGPAPRSNVILDVKPEDDETDLKVLESSVRAITKEGLLWGGSQLEPVAYGLKKLRIIAIVHDDIVSVDELQEEIEKLPGVQSTDIHAFNKV